MKLGLMRKKYVIWYTLSFFNIICCYSQIVNEGVLHVSDSTKMYFENEFTNKNGGFVKNNGSLYLNSDFTNNGLNETHSGKIFYKRSINSILNTSELTETGSLFRVSKPQNNRLIYLGKQTKTFLINAVFSVRNNKGINDCGTFFIKKNSSVLIEITKLSNSISGKVELAKNDHIEIWEQRLINDGSPSINDFSLNIKMSN